MYIHESISLSYPQNEKYFREKLYRKSKHIHDILLSITLFSPNILAVYEMWKFVAQPDRPQI